MVGKDYFWTIAFEKIQIRVQIQRIEKYIFYGMVLGQWFYSISNWYYKQQSDIII